VNVSDEPQVLIIGAGLSGLVAASVLAEHGIRSLVLDKGRAPGGRLATRRLLSSPGQLARADHGAQFFTVRSPDFAELVHQWRRAGIVREWCQGFSAAGDGHPRYCAEGGMNTIAKYLASTLDVESEVTISSVRDGWLVAGVDGRSDLLTTDPSDSLRSPLDRSWSAPVVLLSAPVPQSLALLDAGHVVLPTADRTALETISYARCLALMLVLDGPSAVPEPGGAQLSVAQDPMFSFVADNHRKGVSEAVTLTLHVHDAPSVSMWDEDRDETKAKLIAAARRWTGSASVVDAQLHGWKYARPLVSHPDACLVSTGASGLPLVFIGDAFGGAKVEGAALSGLAGAEHVLSIIGD
jgi:renalase